MADRAWGAALLICFAALFAAGPPAAAQEVPPEAGTGTAASEDAQPEQPFLLQADEVIYDEQLGTVTAVGNVEISNGTRVLLADRVVYSQRDGVVTASGNISLREPTGDYVFAEYLQLDEELRTGFIESVRILTANDARFAANEAQRLPDETSILSKAVYSPCDICADGGAPLWQFKAVRIVHDQELREVRYRDATLEVLGVPVLYLPVFSHADPTVDRKSGFLSPVFGSSSDLGLTIQTPYFFNLAPNRDATFAPIFTTEEGVVAVGEYRALTARGRYELSGSLTHVDQRDAEGNRLGEQEFRGHIFGQGLFDIDTDRRWGFALERATDDTYLDRYDFSEEDTLTSSLYVERFEGRGYAAASAYAFQGLREDDDPGTTPLVAPLLDYSWVAAPVGFGGGLLELDANAVSLYRTDGRDTRRASVLGRWERPYVAPIGLVSTLIAQLRADTYWINDGGEDDESTEDGFAGRVRPLLAADFRYPFVRDAGWARHLVEPIAQLILTPYGGNPDDIPNEDSLSFEFDDTNLFSLNRFPGYDRYESGPRLNYGLKLSAYGRRGGYATALVGQVLRLKDDGTFAEDTGLDQTSSDYVARVTLVPSPYLDLTSRVRVDRDDFSLRRNELYLSVGPQYLRLTGSYVKLDGDETVEELDNREELYLAARARLSPYWTFTAQARRDLKDGGRQIGTALSLGYEDECVGFILTFDRDFTRDRDAEPSTSLQFRVILKTLS